MKLPKNKPSSWLKTTKGLASLGAVALTAGVLAWTVLEQKTTEQHKEIAEQASQNSVGLSNNENRLMTNEKMKQLAEKLEDLAYPAKTLDANLMSKALKAAAKMRSNPPGHEKSGSRWLSVGPQNALVDYNINPRAD